MTEFESWPDKTHICQQSSEQFDARFHGEISVGQHGYSINSYNSSAWSVHGNIPNRGQSTVGSGRWVWPSFLVHRAVNKDIFSPVHVPRILEFFPPSRVNIKIDVASIPKYGVNCDL